MRITTAKSNYICHICNGGIESGDSYWSAPYKTLCLKCGAKIKTGKLKYNRSKGSYIDTMDMKGQPCVKCKKPSKGIWDGKAACEDHIGLVVQESE